MPTDLSHGIPTIRGDTVPELFFAITNCYDALTISIPGQIVDTTADNWILALCSALTNAVPDTNSPGDVTAGDIVA